MSGAWGGPATGAASVGSKIFDAPLTVNVKNLSTGFHFTLAANMASGEDPWGNVPERSTSGGPSQATVVQRRTEYWTSFGAGIIVIWATMSPTALPGLPLPSL